MTFPNASLSNSQTAVAASLSPIGAAYSILQVNAGGTALVYTPGPTPAGLASLGSTVGVAAPTGVAATDTASIQAAYDAVSVFGGTVVFPAGVYITNGGITVPRPTKTIGSGSSDGYSASATDAGVYANESEIASSIIVNMSRTTNVFQINAHGCSFGYLHISNRATLEPTAGAAIRVGAAGVPANGFSIDHCSTNRNYIDVDIVNSDAYSITNNKLIGWVYVGIRTNNTTNSDEGDPIISGNSIMSGTNSASPEAAILYQSGGGLKIIGNKISRKGARPATDAVRLKRGIWLQPPTGSISGVIVITGNSIEAVNEDAVLCDVSLGGALSNVSITGNEFNCSPSLTNYVLRAISGANVPEFVNFDNNIINGCTSVVKSAYFKDLQIGAMVVNGSLQTGPIIDLSNAVNVSYDLNLIKVADRPANCVLISDSTGTDYNSNSPRGGTNKRVVREMPALNLTPTAVNLFRIDIGTSNSNNIAEIELEFCGFASGPGAYAHKVRRMIYGNGAGVAAASVPVGWTDYIFAPGATPTTQQYLNWTFTNSGGYLTIAVAAANGVGIPNLDNTFAGIMAGEVVLTINGTVREVAIS